MTSSSCRGVASTFVTSRSVPVPSTLVWSLPVSSSISQTAIPRPCPLQEARYSVPWCEDYTVADLALQKKKADGPTQPEPPTKKLKSEDEMREEGRESEEELNKKIEAQGEKIRGLKTSKADKVSPAPVCMYISVLFISVHHV